MKSEIKVALIGEQYQKGPYGQITPTPTLRVIWGKLASVTRAEWGEAGRNGHQAQLQVTVRTPEYRGERTAEIGGTRYGIYRTYQTGDETELYLESKVGENADQD